MPKWNPRERWDGSDVFVIGGGTSLRGFDWTRLYREKTIGCNQAFRLGEKVCDICVFGDYKFVYNRDRTLRKSNAVPMSQFRGTILTNEPKLKNVNLPWIHWTARISSGLGRDHTALGWNCNTGALAINVALVLGAKNVYLLGFDMQLSDDNKPNWHDEPLLDKPNVNVYDRMIEKFNDVKIALHKLFPDSNVYNVNENSRLDTFPVVSPSLFWSERDRSCEGYC